MKIYNLLLFVFVSLSAIGFISSKLYKNNVNANLSKEKDSKIVIEPPSSPNVAPAYPPNWPKINNNDNNKVNDDCDDDNCPIPST